MEYIGKNLKKSDCVIVGTYNVLIWLKKRAQYNKIEDVARNYFEYNVDTGFWNGHLDDFMKFWEITATSMVGISQAENEILNGNGAIGVYKRKGETEWHMIFIKPDENRTIKILNSSYKWIDMVLAHSKKELELSIWDVGKAA